MNKSSAIAFMKALKIKQITDRDPWFDGCCPLAPWTHESGRDSSPSFGIHRDDHGKDFFNCWSCESGSLDRLVARLRQEGGVQDGLDLSKAQEILHQSRTDLADLYVVPFDKVKGTAVQQVKVWPESTLLDLKRAEQASRAMDYLQGKRGLSVETIRELDIRYDFFSDTVCFPIRDFYGSLVGLHGRYIDPTNPKKRYHFYGTPEIRNTHVWFGEHLIDFTKPLIAVESVFDVAAIYPVYGNVMAPLSAGFNPAKLSRIRSATGIITFFDGDKAGDLARNAIKKEFPNLLVVHLVPDPGKDPADYSEAKLTKLVDAALSKFPIWGQLQGAY